jgi:ribose transport system permease protein
MFSLFSPPEVSPAPPSVSGQGRGALLPLLDFVGLLLVLLFLVGLFGTLGKYFLTFNTFKTLANEIPSLTIVATGMTFVLIIAGIDLSVGSVLALGGAMLGLTMVDHQGPLWMGAALCLFVTTLCGLFNGLVSVRWTIPSFIVTLGMLEVARGFASLVTKSETKYIGASVTGLGDPLPGIELSPAFFAALAVVILGQLTLSLTRFGRYARATGSNEPTARLCGISTGRVKVAVFALSGFLTGLASLFYCSRLASADPNAGVGLELSAIAAAVIGGTSLMGGRGSVVNTFLGVLIIATLQTGLNQLSAPEPVKRLVTGLVIVLAVIADSYRSRLMRKG